MFRRRKYTCVFFLIMIFRFHPAVQIIKLSAINLYILSQSNFLPVVSFTYFNMLSDNILMREISELQRLSFKLYLLAWIKSPWLIP